MRVLWLSDAGSHTGFSTVTHNIGERLVRDYGHDISVLAINHRGDYWPTNLKLYVPTLLNQRDIYGHSRIIEMISEVMPEVIVIVNDPSAVLKYLFDNRYDEQRVLLQFAPLLLYMPIDGVEQLPAWKELPKVGRFVAMTEFGRETFWPEADVVYHGVDTETYRPVSKERPLVMSDGTTVTTKAECKAVFGFEDSFLVLRVDRNSYRKNYPDTVKALWTLMDDHDDIVASFHCQPNDPAGYNLGAMLTRRPDLKERFVFPGNHDTFQGWPVEDMAVLYNAADVFVSTSWGEGFGLTLAEAAACAVPIVAPNFSTIPEVVGPGAILIEPERSMTVPAGHDQMLPDVDGFRYGIERLYGDAELREELGRIGAEHIRANFSWDKAAADFDALIEELAAEGAARRAARDTTDSPQSVRDE